MMTNGWQTVELGKIMKVEIDAVAVDTQPEFQMAGVYSFARGLFKRESLPNTQTTYKLFHRLHKDMFVISVPKGWEGALARVTDDFDGMFLSPVFPTFRANPKELDIRYFEWYCRQSQVWDELRRKSRGIGARRESISAEQFLTLEIPLPPLTEQRRIVAHIESLAARVNEAQRLREEAERELNSLSDSFLGQLLAENYPNWSYGKIPEFAEVNPSRKGQITLTDEDLASFVPMRAVDDITGTIAKPEPRPFREISKGYTWFQDGDVIFARITPCMENGKSAIAKNLVNGTGFGSTEFHVLRPSDKVLAEWLYVLARSKQFRNDAADHFKGTAGQQRVPQSFLDNKIIPVPPLDEQRRIVAYLDGLQAKINALRELQSASGEELSALMPSVLDKAFKGKL